MKVNLNDLINVYERDIIKNVKNKKSIMLFDRNKMQNIISIWNDLNNNNYIPDKYNIFLIFEPKCRIVMSLSIRDKIVNHYVAKYILIPKLNKYLDKRNVATRKNMGTDYGIKLIKSYMEYMKRYDNIYVLKIDISKYFYNIDHEVLKSKIKDKLNIEEYLLVCKIIDSTNNEYINKEIDKYKNSNKFKDRKDSINELPYYLKGKGLSIGAMVSQFLSVYYFHELDNYIVNKLDIKCYCRYQDDLVLFYYDKDYLINCFNIIKNKFKNEYKLDINYKKSFIINIKNGFNFLGYNYKIIDKKSIIIINGITKKRIRDNIKKNKYLYDNNIIKFNRYYNSNNNYINGYKYACNNNMKYKEY